MRRSIVALVLLGTPLPAASQLPTPLLPPRVPAAARESPPADPEEQPDSAPQLSPWFPIRSQENAKAFWGRDDSKILSSGALLLEDKVFGANLELLSDIVGRFRIGLQVTAAAADQEDESPEAAELADEQEAAARLANAGGIVRINAALPVFFKSSPEFRSIWALMWTATGGSEAPKSGAFLEDPAVTAQSGLELFYQRGGLDERIDFEFGIASRAYWFNSTYATKVGTDDNWAGILAPKFGIVLLRNTKIDLIWRVSKSDAFADLGTIAVTLQQIAR